MTASIRFFLRTAAARVHIAPQALGPTTLRQATLCTHRRDKSDGVLIVTDVATSQRIEDVASSRLRNGTMLPHPKEVAVHLYASGSPHAPSETTSHAVRTQAWQTHSAGYTLSKTSLAWLQAAASGLFPPGLSG